MIIAAKLSGIDPGLLANAILRAIWVENRDIADPRHAAQIGRRARNRRRATARQRARATTIETLDRYTQEAQDRGVFGSPFYFLGEEDFWGQDRLQFLEDALARSTRQGTLPPLIAPTQ